MKAQRGGGDTPLSAAASAESAQVGGWEHMPGDEVQGQGTHRLPRGEPESRAQPRPCSGSLSPRVGMPLNTVPLSFICLLPSSRKGLKSQDSENRGAKMARRSPGPWFVPWVCLVLVLYLGEGQEEKPFGEMCLEDFTAGLPDWVLDTDASVQNGATFLSSPMVHRSRDCMRACCKDPACNLALVEQGPGSEEDHIQGCFLLNCLYEKTFVCRFARKIGFLNFLKKDVYDSYLAMQNHRPSGKVPIMNPCKPGLEEH